MPSSDSSSADGRSIDPADLATALRVLAAAETLEKDDPDYVTLRHATGKLYKAVKLQGRRDKRDRIAEADRAVVAATATGAADRIDDETRGIPLAARIAAP
ncbi:MAG: dehydrogenase with different specificity, partial [Microbacterium sp.]|nr:dehydrogenase with different specificity [Microbacterium sp.]